MGIGNSFLKRTSIAQIPPPELTNVTHGIKMLWAGEMACSTSLET